MFNFSCGGVSAACLKDGVHIFFEDFSCFKLLLRLQVTGCYCKRQFSRYDCGYDESAARNIIRRLQNAATTLLPRLRSRLLVMGKSAHDFDMRDVRRPDQCRRSSAHRVQSGAVRGYSRGRARHRYQKS